MPIRAESSHIKVSAGGIGGLLNRLCWGGCCEKAQIVICPDCARLAAEVHRLRKKYQAGLVRLHNAVNTLTRSTLRFQKLKSTVEDLGREYNRAQLALERHRRTHLKMLRC